MRKRSSTAALARSLAALALVAACGSASPEQQLLNNFFHAARIRDNTVLANIAAVNFNPRTDGTVEQFEVVDVGAETKRALDLTALATPAADAHDEAEAQAAALLQRERSLVVNSLTPP